MNIRERRIEVAALRGMAYRYANEGPDFIAAVRKLAEDTEVYLPAADRSPAKQSRRKGFGEPDWSVLQYPELVELAAKAARQVSKEFKDQQVGMLCEPDDTYQEALILVARALGADPEFNNLPSGQQFLHVWRALRDQVKYRIEPASATIYTSTLENRGV